MTDNAKQTSLRRRAGLILGVCGAALAGCVYYGPPPGAMAAPPGGDYGPNYAQTAPIPPADSAPSQPSAAGPSYQPSAPGPGYQPSAPGSSYQPYASAPSYAPEPSYAPRGGYTAPAGAAYAPPGGAPAYGAVPYGMRGRAVTRAEFIERHQQRAATMGKDPAHVAERASRRFDMMDTDRDGVLQPEERAAWRATHPGRQGGAARADALPGAGAPGPAWQAPVSAGQGPQYEQ